MKEQACPLLFFYYFWLRLLRLSFYMYGAKEVALQSCTCSLPTHFPQVPGVFSSSLHTPLGHSVQVRLAQPRMHHPYCTLRASWSRLHACPGHTGNQTSGGRVLKQHKLIAWAILGINLQQCCIWVWQKFFTLAVKNKEAGIRLSE